MATQKYSLENKVVAVLGCVSGIGLATVEILLKQKNVKGVALLDFNVKSGEELLERLSKECPSKKITFNKCDVTVKEDIEKSFNAIWESFGNVDVLINLAGIFDDENWRLSIDVNLNGLIESSLQGLSRMRRDRGGSGGTIINISSLAGVIPIVYVPIYTATKYAVRSFTTCLGLPLQYDMTGVRTLTICPNSVHTAVIHDAHNRVFDPTMTIPFKEHLESSPYMTTEYVAGGIMEAYENGESASVWAVSTNKIAAIPESSISLPFSFLSDAEL